MCIQTLINFFCLGRLRADVTGLSVSTVTPVFFGRLTVITVNITSVHSQSVETKLRTLSINKEKAPSIRSCIATAALKSHSKFSLQSALQESSSVYQSIAYYTQKFKKVKFDSIRHSVCLSIYVCPLCWSSHVILIVVFFLFKESGATDN